MLVVYSSKTGNTDLFLKKLDLKHCMKIQKDNIPNQVVNENFVLLTYTTGLGEVPIEVDEFLKYKENSKYLKAVIASGNRNFGSSFAKAGDIISSIYGVPIIMKYELIGNKHDVNKLKKYLSTH